MNNELVIFSKPKGSTAEAIRTLRTNLQFTFVDNNVKVIMVTSSMPGEGKSFTSSNLAASFVMTGSKVLLVDCDLRKGRQSEIFKIENEKGLSNLLLDDIKNYKKYIKKTEIDNLFILPSGIFPPNPSELLGSEKAKKLVDTLKNDYDLIILDCPPVNAVTDALIVTSLADEAVVVGSYKHTPIDLLMQTIKSLQSTNIKIAGIVLNKTKREKGKYYYEGYYK